MSGKELGERDFAVSNKKIPFSLSFIEKHNLFPILFFFPQRDFPILNLRDIPKHYLSEKWEIRKNVQKPIRSPLEVE